MDLHFYIDLFGLAVTTLAVFQLFSDPRGPDPRGPRLKLLLIAAIVTLLVAVAFAYVVQRSHRTTIENIQTRIRADLETGSKTNEDFAQRLTAAEAIYLQEALDELVQNNVIQSQIVTLSNCDGSLLATARKYHR
jgi:hypothetical protein